MTIFKIDTFTNLHNYICLISANSALIKCDSEFLSEPIGHFWPAQCTLLCLIEQMLKSMRNIILFLRSQDNYCFIQGSMYNAHHHF